MKIAERGDKRTGLNTKMQCICVHMGNVFFYSILIKMRFLTNGGRG